jgi:hypothetical protein
MEWREYCLGFWCTLICAIQMIGRACILCLHVFPHLQVLHCDSKRECKSFESSDQTCGIISKIGGHLSNILRL